ncbi:MAG: hypothetical protein ONB13_10060, partial [candidate division KSB1 bacterium]|nr:hypothetical protein [candidate division KSB1 bacterium]
IRRNDRKVDSCIRRNDSASSVMPPKAGIPFGRLLSQVPSIAEKTIIRIALTDHQINAAQSAR